MRSFRTITRDAAIPVGFLIVVLVAWEVCTRACGVPQYLLPPASTIAWRITEDAPGLATHAAVTMLEAVLGFVIANVLGFLIGIICAHSRPAEKAIYPYAIALKTTPIVALAPILVLWLGSGITSKIAASAAICFFPILVNATRGLRRVDNEALDLFRSFAASRLAIFMKLRLPNSLPYIFSALKISTSLSIVGAIVGEFVGSQRGLGYLILVASYHLETADMFAAVFVAAICGVAFFGVISLAERRLVTWGEPLAGA